MSIQKEVENFIMDRPSIKDCLKNGLVNFSSLSRRISDELKLNIKKDFDAILIACRRFQEKLKKEQESEGKIIGILRKSKIEVKNKVVAIVVEKEIYYETLIELEKEIRKRKETFRIIEGASANTIITSEEFSDLVKKYFKNKIIAENSRLAEITIMSPEEIEEVPGTYAYICSLFGEHNVNIVETMSCWTDTIFFVDEKDVGKVMGFFRF